MNKSVNRIVPLAWLLLIVAPATGQFFAVQSGAGPWPLEPLNCGVQQTSNTAPLTLSGCEPVFDCVLNMVFATGEITVNNASIEHTSHGWTRAGWNSCGLGWPYEQWGRFLHTDLVFSGPSNPSGNVAVRWQLDYEFIMEIVHAIPDDVPWGAVVKVVLQMPTGQVIDTYVQVIATLFPDGHIIIIENPLGGAVEQLAPRKWKFSGRWVSPQVQLPIGLPLNFDLALRGAHGVGGQTNTAYGFYNSDQYLTARVSVPVGEPVFILPDGFTADSATMGLVDNIIAPPPCPADLAPPIGVLDLNDVNTFISGFLDQDPISDLDGNSIWDLNDIGIFGASFMAGCP